jgi:hypothetical protein
MNLSAWIRCFGLALGWLVATFAFADGLPSAGAVSKISDVGYRTVAEALASLKLKKDVSFSTAGGWTIVTDEAHLTVWSFSPKTDPSYPSVVRRMVTSTGDGSKVSLSVLCEAGKAACDTLVREFSSTKGAR